MPLATFVFVSSISHRRPRNRSASICGHGRRSHVTTDRPTYSLPVRDRFSTPRSDMSVSAADGPDTCLTGEGLARFEPWSGGACAMNDQRRVVVTGVGAVTPLALSAEGSWEGIRVRKVGYAAHRPSDERIKSRFFGRLPDGASARLRIPRSFRRQMPLFAQYALSAANEAMNEAFPEEPWDRTFSNFRTGVVIGTGWGGLDAGNLHNNE